MRIRKQKSLIDRAHDYVESVAETVIPQLEAALDSARDKAGPVIAEARDKAGPAIADARDKAAPLIADARDKAAPVLAEGRALAAEKAVAGAEKAAAGAAVAAAAAADAAAASREFAATKVAELRHEPEPQGSKLKKVLLLGGLLAIGGAVFSKLRQSAGGDNWQSSYVPSPPPGPPVTSDPVSPVAPVEPIVEPVADAAPETTDDPGGGAPGEALSDAAETPHEVTTPDAPAEIIDVDDVPENSENRD